MSQGLRRPLVGFPNEGGYGGPIRFEVCTHPAQLTWRSKNLDFDCPGIFRASTHEKNSDCTKKRYLALLTKGLSHDSHEIPPRLVSTSHPLLFD